MGDMNGTVLANRPLKGDYWLAEFLLDGPAEPPAPGRFLMARVGSCADPLLRRPFGIHDFEVTAPGRSLLKILYRVVGRGTRLMTGFAPGAPADLLGPLGRAFDLDASGSEPSILAGGIGGAPLLYLARRLVEAGKRPRVYAGGNSAADVLGVEEFRALGCEVRAATMDGSLGFRGTVVDLFRREEGERRSGDLVYACGPWPMLASLALSCRACSRPMQATVDAVMACGMGLCLGCAVRAAPGSGRDYLMVCKDGPVFGLEEVAWENPT